MNTFKYTRYSTEKRSEYNQINFPTERLIEFRILAFWDDSRAFSYTKSKYLTHVAHIALKVGLGVKKKSHPNLDAPYIDYSLDFTLKTWLDILVYLR